MTPAPYYSGGPLADVAADFRRHLDADRIYPITTLPGVTTMSRPVPDDTRTEAYVPRATLRRILRDGHEPEACFVGREVPARYDRYRASVVASLVEQAATEAGVRLLVWRGDRPPVPV